MRMLDETRFEVLKNMPLEPDFLEKIAKHLDYNELAIAYQCKTIGEFLDTIIEQKLIIISKVLEKED